MKIIVKAKPNSKVESVERLGQPTLGLEDVRSTMVEYKVSVKEAPVGGRANEAIVKALAKYFDVAPSLISLVSGGSGKKKIFEVPELKR